jgi:hypothetical protein
LLTCCPWVRFIREEFHTSETKTTTILTIYNFTKQVSFYLLRRLKEKPLTLKFSKI